MGRREEIWKTPRRQIKEMDAVGTMKDRCGKRNTTNASISIIDVSISLEYSVCDELQRLVVREYGYEKMLDSTVCRSSPI